MRKSVKQLKIPTLYTDWYFSPFKERSLFKRIRGYISSFRYKFRSWYTSKKLYRKIYDFCHPWDTYKTTYSLEELKEKLSKRYLNNARKQYPIRFFLFETIPYEIFYPIKWKIARFLEKAKIVLTKDYKNIIVVDSLDKFMYHDPDTLILHGIFDVTARFIKDNRFMFAWEIHKNEWKAINEAYYWYIVDYPILQKELDESYLLLSKMDESGQYSREKEKEIFDRIHELEERIFKEKVHYAKLIIDNCHILWD